MSDDSSVNLDVETAPKSLFQVIWSSLIRKISDIEGQEFRDQWRLRAYPAGNAGFASTKTPLTLLVALCPFGGGLTILFDTMVSVIGAIRCVIIGTAIFGIAIRT